MFMKVLRLARKEVTLTSGNPFGFRPNLKKRRVLKQENLVTQDVKKALMSADQNVIVMVRG